MKNKFIAAHLLFFAHLAAVAQIETTPIEKPLASALLWNNQGVHLGDDPKTIDKVLLLKAALDRHRADQINYPIFVGTLNATGTNVLIHCCPRSAELMVLDSPLPRYFGVFR